MIDVNEDQINHTLFVRLIILIQKLASFVSKHCLQWRVYRCLSLSEEFLLLFLSSEVFFVVDEYIFIDMSETEKIDHYWREKNNSNCWHQSFFYVDDYDCWKRKRRLHIYHLQLIQNSRVIVTDFLRNKTKRDVKVDMHDCLITDYE